MTLLTRARHTQAFRKVYYDENLEIFTPQSKTTKLMSRFDSNLKEQVILWVDVLSAFNNVFQVQDDDTVVQFLADENLNILQPLRFRSCPGVVLNVIIQAPSQPITNAPQIIQGNAISDCKTDLISNPIDLNDNRELSTKNETDVQEFTTPIPQPNSLVSPLAVSTEAAVDGSLNPSDSNGNQIENYPQPAPINEDGGHSLTTEAVTDRR
ncbi:hypothetical protein BGZ46_004911, partial [Entomortierella lignicola]